MAISCGFFNAVNGDRTYNAEQMNNPYKRIVSNGVFAKGDGTPSNDFKVIADGTLTLKVSAGDGIFDGKWANNDAPYNATIQTPDVSNPRIDSIVFSVDYTNRQGIIGVVKGTPAVNPVPPSIMRSHTRMDYRLANVRVDANATGIVQSDVTDTRAGSDCGFITSLLKQPDITAIYDQWQAQFEAWFADVKETLATSTLIRSYTSRYITATQDETVIPILITQFNKNLDILQVFINGLRLLPDVEYTIDSNTQITLANGVDPNTPISFVVYKSVDGSDAETVVTQVYQLQQIQVTSNGGGVKSSVSVAGDVLSQFVSLGSGFHTMYSASGAANAPKQGAFRYFGHMTSATVGWLIAMQADGSIYSNYYNAGTWTGWKVLHEKTPTALYYSERGTFPTAGTTITPSKSLSECQHGWQLVFCGYDDVEKAARDVYVQNFCIPKKSHKNANWNGESVSVPLIYQYVNESDSSLMCQKTLIVYNDRLFGGTSASTGKQRNMVLKAIYEY